MEPTLSPTIAPTLEPTLSPTIAPTLSPSLSPTTLSPTTSPTLEPTEAPTSSQQPSEIGGLPVPPAPGPGLGTHYPTYRPTKDYSGKSGKSEKPPSTRHPTPGPTRRAKTQKPTQKTSKPTISPRPSVSPSPTDYRPIFGKSGKSEKPPATKASPTHGKPKVPAFGGKSGKGPGPKFFKEDLSRSSKSGKWETQALPVRYNTK